MYLSKGFLTGLILLATPSLAGAATYVLGDSIGDGLAVTMKLNNLAQIGIHIRGPKALAQIARTPEGSTVYIFLGTNDAEGSIKNIDKSIDDVLAAAALRKLTVIWVGPSCVHKSWDAQASALDRILSDRLAKAGVKYIGTRDQEMCTGKLLEPDGVHPNGKGYRHMWAKIESAGDAPPAVVASAAPLQLPAKAAEQSEFATASIAPRPAPPRAANAPAVHRLVMDIHVPGAPTEPLVWTRSQN
jgi:hypothetical protein